MKISKKSHYGLQACYYLAQVYPNSTLSNKDLEKRIFVSAKYLERIMSCLSSGGIVGAKKGVSGGYYLMREPEKITVGDIVRTLEDDLEIFDCVKKSDCTKCPSAVVWRKLYKGMNDLLDSISLKQMISED